MLAGSINYDLSLGFVLTFFLAWLLSFSLLPLINGLAILTVEWTLRKRIGLASMLAFAFIWSPSLLLGFLNFGLSLGLALLAACAFVLDAWESRDQLTSANLGLLAIGFVTAFLVAMFVIKVMLAIVTRRGFAPFGWLRIAIGGAGLLALLAMPR